MASVTTASFLDGALSVLLPPRYKNVLPCCFPKHAGHFLLCFSLTHLQLLFGVALRELGGFRSVKIEDKSRVTSAVVRPRHFLAFCFKNANSRLQPSLD